MSVHCFEHASTVDTFGTVTQPRVEAVVFVAVPDVYVDANEDEDSNSNSKDAKAYKTKADAWALVACAEWV